MEPMTRRINNILLISPFYSPNIGGVETHLTDLADYLSTHGYKTYVLTYRPLTTNAPFLSFEKRKNLEIRRFWWIGFNLFNRLEPYPILEFFYLTPWLFFCSILWMLKNSREIDVIHAHGFNAAFIAKVLGFIFKKKYVVSTHAIYGLSSATLLSQMMFWTLISANRILTLSHQSKDELVSIGIPENKVDVYNYWIDLDLFRVNDKKLAKEFLGWSEKFIVLFVGRLIEIKGIRLAVHVADELKKDGIYFAFIGDGPLKNYLENTSKNAGNLLFLGKINNKDLPIYYNGSDILIIPSQYEEGFGRVILEAIACGLPVVGSNMGGIPEAVDSTVSLLVEPTLGQLKDAIRDLYFDKDKYDLLAGNCRDYAIDHYSSDNCMTIINAYNS